ncbi:MAG: hypothetical protein HY540_07020 [Deltaproteobacteria bacterium]|nr:hypothetical protein [Deltaproteobacteria bacterium]
MVISGLVAPVSVSLPQHQTLALGAVISTGIVQQTLLQPNPEVPPLPTTASAKQVAAWMRQHPHAASDLFAYPQGEPLQALRRFKSAMKPAWLSVATVPLLDPDIRSLFAEVHVSVFTRYLSDLLIQAAKLAEAAQDQTTLQHLPPHIYGFPSRTAEQNYVSDLSPASLWVFLRNVPPPPESDTLTWQTLARLVLDVERKGGEEKRQQGTTIERLTAWGTWFGSWMFRLGEAKLEVARSELAQQTVNDALFYLQQGSSLQAAQCLRQRSGFENHQGGFLHHQWLYRHLAGDILFESGKMCLDSKDYEQAQSRFEGAAAEYRTIGSIADEHAALARLAQIFMSPDLSSLDGFRAFQKGGKIIQQIGGLPKGVSRDMASALAEETRRLTANR